MRCGRSGRGRERGGKRRKEVEDACGGLLSSFQPLTSYFNSCPFSLSLSVSFHLLFLALLSAFKWVFDECMYAQMNLLRMRRTGWRDGLSFRLWLVADGEGEGELGGVAVVVVGRKGLEFMWFWNRDGPRVVMGGSWVREFEEEGVIMSFAFFLLVELLCTCLSCCSKVSWSGWSK